MSDYYDRQGNPLTSDEWALRFSAKRNWEDFRVALTEYGEITVSTVWLGLDYSFGHGPPLIFETMVFGGEYDQYQERYSTEEQALAGHNATVAMVLEKEREQDAGTTTIPDP